jgi:hypothetical protein
MSRRGAPTEVHSTAAQARCLHKLTGAAGFQLKIARETLLNIASVFMTRRFSTACFYEQ